MGLLKANRTGGLSKVGALPCPDNPEGLLAVALPCPDFSRRVTGSSLPCPDASRDVPAGTSLGSPGGRIEDGDGPFDELAGRVSALAEILPGLILPCPDNSLVSAPVPEIPGPGVWNRGLRLWTGGGGDDDESERSLCHGTVALRYRRPLVLRRD